MGTIRGEIGGEATGKIGDVTISSWKGMKVIKRKRGPSTKPKTPAQQAQNDVFTAASEFAGSLAKEEEAIYKKLAEGKPTTWRAVAMQDKLTPPIISRVMADNYHGHAGDSIEVFVHDTTCVKVEVTIYNPEGAAEGEPGVEVEAGDAERGNPNSDARWIYHAQQEFAGAAFVLEINARDLARNLTTHTLEGDL